MNVNGLPDGTIAPGSRESVVINAMGRFNADAAPPDAVTFFFRADFRDDWILVETFRVGSDAFPQQPDDAFYVDMDITALAGSVAASGFQIGMQFFNDEHPQSDPPIFHDP